MSARLVRVEEGRQGEAFALESTECVMGRDPGADIVLEFPRVSRRHAVVRALGDRHTVADLGSSNGTTVNGAPVRDAVVLRPGDLLELGGEVTLLYELGEPRGRALPQPAVLAVALGLVLALAAGLGAWWLMRGGAPALDPESLDLAQRGLAAARSGDPAGAKEHLQRASFLLFQRGFLDDVSRDEAQRVGLQRLGAELEGEPDLWSVYQTAVQAARPRPPPGRRERGCRLDQVRPRDLEACLRERIELVMADLRQKPAEIDSIPDDFHHQVGERLRREHTFLSRSLARGRPLVPKLQQALEDENMPPMLHYLALIESGYNPDAVSPAKAMGLWQFMPATARQYGLHVGGARDERRDVEKSTHAAVRYLKGLAFEFGGDALLLALAGYNRGENGVRRALKKLDDPFADRSYWRLVERELLPHETALYVARFMAAAVAGEAGLPDVETLEAAGY